jgi:ADP-heptose:LPS heptosyltransferase
MKILNVSSVVTLCNRKFNNRYDRSVALHDILSISAPIDSFRDHDRTGIVFFYGAAWKNREVPDYVAVSIVKKLIVLLNVNIVIVLQPTDDFNTWSILFDFSDKISIVQDSLFNVAIIISKAALVVSTDSSWLHIAQTYGVPTVGFYGFDNAKEWAPPGCEIIYSEDVLPAKNRYDLSKENICPLANLNPKFVAQTIYTKYVNSIKSKRSLESIGVLY